MFCSSTESFSELYPKCHIKWVLIWEQNWSENSFQFCYSEQKIDCFGLQFWCLLFLFKFVFKTIN